MLAGSLVVLLAASLVIAANVVAPGVAFAAEKSKIAEMMARQAMSTYESGDFLRAAQLYLEAYRTDARAAFLWAAARAEHVGGSFDKAADHYRQALALSDMDPAVRAKAEAYLCEVQQARADAKLTEAEKSIRRGDLRLGTVLYHEAFALAPQRFEFLFKAAVAEQTAGDLAAAERDYAAYLQGAPADAGDRNQAHVRLESLRVASGPTGPAAPGLPLPLPAAVAPGAAVTVVPTDPGTNWLGRSALVGGAALLASGAGLWLSQGGERADLDAALARRDGSQVIGIGYDAYVQRRDDLNGNYRTAATLGGVGVAAAGVGAWLLVRTPAQAVHVAPNVQLAAAPGTAGLNLAWRF